MGLAACCRLIVTALLLAGASLAAAQDAESIAALNQQVEQLYHAGRYAEATDIAQRSLALAEGQFGPDHPDVAEAVNNLALLSQVQGRYDEAERLHRRALAITEKTRGPEHPDVGTSLSNLASLYQALGRYAEAEPLHQRALTITEQARGPEHPDVGIRLNNLAELFRAQGRYAEAEPLYRRSLAIFEKALGPDHPNVGTLLSNLTELYRAQGRYGEAEPLHLRALAISEKALGPDHPDVGLRLNNLALLYQAQGRYGEAEALCRRALAIFEKTLGTEHAQVGTLLTNLAEMYRAQGRHSEAEPLYQRALVILEKALGPDHPHAGTLLNNLAALYQAQGRYDEAELLYRRALALREKALGPDHPDVGISLINLAALYQDRDRHSEAAPLYQRALTINEKALGPDHPDVGTSLNDLAELYRAQGRYPEALALHQRALAIREKALGPDHAQVAASLNNLGLLYGDQGRHSEAEPLYLRALAIGEKALGPDHAQVGTSLNNLAALYFAQRDWPRAAEYWRRSTAVIVRGAERGTADVGRAVTGKRKGEAEQLRDRFWVLAKAVHRIALQRPGGDASLLHEMFQTAQWAQGSEAAASLAQMAARGAKGDPALAVLVRERQDLVEDWQRRDGARSAAVAQTPDKRDRAAETANVARLTAIDLRITDIDKRLVAQFPDYAALARPTPLSVTEVQAELGASEALVLFLDTPEWQPTPEETFIWVVTKTDARWVRSDLGAPSLKREVAALRCGLDAAAWADDGGDSCASLPQVQAPKGKAPLPFDTAHAHALYKALFGQVEDLIRGKHLLIVPSGPLTQLPFQVLVTASAAGKDYRSAAWLARQNAITVLPAVASLKALRRISRPSAATRPMIGFGNPLLDGDPATRPWEAEWARLSKQKQTCPQTPWQRLAGLFQHRRGVVPMATRSGRPDLDNLRMQMPLHDTADELCAVAKDLKVAPDDIVLGARATETTVKRMSGEGRLAQYRVVHFATHGTLAGDISGTSEPGLMLTPPSEQTELDDGYLSASEIAALKLDADWVILSACNTAAGGAQGAEALSGLARAFIYAGARALLVAHWAVDSAATVKLITHAVGAMSRDKTIGRAEALRRAMLAMIDKGALREAHPAFWAPFVVVGEGAAAR
jgi:tetratricopeptide (TPR) repeat protein/CHAT domain-containing protein